MPNNLPKLAIVSSHPIQYYAPVFRMLHERGRVAIQVFYSWGEASLKKFDKGFGKTIEWDIPLLQGYPYNFAENKSTDPGTHHFKGIQTPDLPLQIQAWQPDALLIFGWNYAGHLQLLRFFKGKIPIYFRGDSTLLDEQPGFRRIARRVFLRWIYRKVDYAFYVGTNNRAYLKAHGLRDRQLIFAPHAIDNARFADGPDKNYQAQAQAWRQELGYQPQDKVLVFAGKFEPKKDPLLLLQAVQTVNQVLPQPLKLLFVGNGVLEEQLRSQADNDPNIHFAGFQNQSRMPVVYRAGDLFCLPSRGPGETWGLAVNEAMACGRAALVSTKVGGAVDLVKPGANGFSFPAGHLPALKKSLQAAASADLEEMGCNAEEFIQAWSFEKLVTAIENALHE